MRTRVALITLIILTLFAAACGRGTETPPDAQSPALATEADTEATAAEVETPVAPEATLGPVTVNYAYDDAGRLVAADYGEARIEYTYDANGNLLARQVIGSGDSAAAALPPADADSNFVGRVGNSSFKPSNIGLLGSAALLLGLALMSFRANAMSEESPIRKRLQGFLAAGAARNNIFRSRRWRARLRAALSRAIRLTVAFSLAVGLLATTTGTAYARRDVVCINGIPHVFLEDSTPGMQVRVNADRKEFSFKIPESGSGYFPIGGPGDSYANVVLATPDFLAELGPITCPVETGLVGNQGQETPGSYDTALNSGGNSGYAGDPVSTSLGEYYFGLPLLDLGGALPLRFALSYAASLQKSPALRNDPFGGDNFTHNHHAALQVKDDGTIVIFMNSGDLIHFEQGESGWQMFDEEVIYRLREGANFYWLLDPIHERLYTFQKSNGALARVEDRNGNALMYTNDSAGRVTRVEDGLGRTLDFTYTNPTDEWNWPHLASVSDQAGRSVRFDYQVESGEVMAVHLASVTDPAGNTTTFDYSGDPSTGSGQALLNNVVAAVTRPAGNTPYTQTYEQGEDELWRVTTQSDAYDNTTSLSYDDATTSVTDPFGNIYQHTHAGNRRLTSWTDETGQTVPIGYDEQGRRASVANRRGETSTLAYHPETGKMAAFTDAEGNTTGFTYAAQEQTFSTPEGDLSVTFYNLTRVAYADGSHVEFTYDGRGNVTTVTDPRGALWVYTYNERGQLLSRANPNGGETIYTYNDDGTLASSTNSEAGLTTYEYDAYKRPVAVTRPDGSALQFTYDASDRLLSVADELGQTTTLTYDANGNLLTATDALGQTSTYAYDLMDRLSSLSDPVGQVDNLSYDALGRVQSVANRNGAITTLAYDPRGRLTTLTDAAGETWRAAYDDEGVLTAATTPLGFTTAFQPDWLGRIAAISDPLSATLDLSYDARSRLTAVSDRLGRATSYAYDAGGLLASVTPPLVGTFTYSYDDLGLLTRVGDPLGANWDFAYSPMGLLQTHSDPLGNAWGYAYDERSQLAQIAFPGGEVADFTRDAAGRLTHVAYSGGLSLDYGYDAADRLLTTEGLTLTYDERGDIVASQDGEASFGATYDAGRRLETLSYDGQATVTYTYDARDKITRVEDDFSGTWMEFAYDADGRLTEISRSNGVSTTLTYDAAGRVIGIQDGTLADQQYTLNAEGEPVQVVRELPLDPVGRIDNSSYTYDDASQISSPGYAYDARGRQTAAPGASFAWDGAGRLTSVAAEAGAVELAYNGLDDLRSRTADGETTSYYHNYALGLAPVVAERAGDEYERFYVYTPGGALLYAIDAASGAASFYHFDRVGSTQFLTDDGGDVSDAYTYDPYGNLLGHEGASEQPYTYVGQWGVRQEPVGGPSASFGSAQDGGKGNSLYHMRARYYDPAAARFLSRDPIWPVLDDPQSLNPYQYAYQNPLQYIDPEGTAVPVVVVWGGRIAFFVVKTWIVWAITAKPANQGSEITAQEIEARRAAELRKMRSQQHQELMAKLRAEHARYKQLRRDIDLLDKGIIPDDPAPGAQEGSPDQGNRISGTPSAINAPPGGMMYRAGASGAGSDVIYGGIFDYLFGGSGDEALDKLLFEGFPPLLLPDITEGFSYHY